MDPIFVNGVERYTGWHPTPASTLSRMHRDGRMRFSHDRATPCGEWCESSCEHFWKYRDDQDSQSSCVGFSAAHAASITFAKQGFDVHVSPAALYAQINGGSDNGANCGDCLDALQAVGAFPSGFLSIGDLDWKKAYRTKFWQNPDSELAKEAARYRALEVVLCTSVADFLDGLQTGLWAGQFCLGAGRNFETDGFGFLPAYDGTTVNHALCATGGMRKNPKNGKWGVEGANSWSDWGLDGSGLFYVTEDWLDVPYQEMWLLRATTLPS
jgi:hypothetical protein